jgi:kynureninase
MEVNYRPASATERMRVGTPPLLQLAVLQEALKGWEGVDMAELRAASVRLSELFIAEVEARCPELTLASPRASAERGSQVSFAFEHGYAAMQALIDRGVIGDFRAPNIMRFGFTPLYLEEVDIVAAAEILEGVMSNQLWKKEKYQTRSRVT